MKRAVTYPITDPSNAGEIRRTLAGWTEQLQFDSVLSGKVSIVINELTTNILKHATRGELICLSDDQSISIIAVDNGPGIPDINAALEDGHSTHGTAGNGLGAIKRLSTVFDIYTQPGKGTIVLSRFTSVTEPEKFGCFGFSLPIKGEYVSGDGWVDIEEDIHKIMVSDGLGHGLLAHEASNTAIKVFLESEHSNPLNDVNLLHLGLRSTRGAAIAVGYIDLQKQVLDYCGLGNIAGAVVNQTGTKKLISYPGTAGVQMRKTQSLAYPFNKNSFLVLHSDGLHTQWDLKDYPGVLIKHPLIVASLLYRDHNRKTDDVTVIVGKFV